MVAQDITDPFHRQLYMELTEEIARRTEQLASGSALLIVNDTGTIAEKYAAQVSYIKALYSVLERCKEIETERYGGKPSHN